MCVRARVCVRVCVCVSECVVYTYVCVYICVDWHTCVVYTYVSMCVYVLACMVQVCGMHVHVYVLCMCTCMCMHVRMHAGEQGLSVYACMHACIYVYTNTVHACIYVYTNTGGEHHACTYARMCLRTYIHRR